MEIEKALDIIAEADLKVVKREPNILRFPSLGMDPKELWCVIYDGIELSHVEVFNYIEDVWVDGDEVVVKWERGSISKKRMKEAIRDSVEDHMKWATSSEKEYSEDVVNRWHESFEKAK